MRSTLSCCCVVVCALTTGASTYGQIGATYNRVVRHVAVTPDPTAPGGWMITGVFTVEATAPPVALTEGIAALDDVSTIVEVRINGVTVAQTPFTLQIDPSTLGGPCGGTCGSGVTNGMTAALLCIDGQCQYPPITNTVPTPSSLQPGDVVVVILSPSPGALPDSNTADDSRILTMGTDPIGWNRGVKNVTLTPSVPVGPITEVATFDVFFDVEYSSFGLTEQLRLGVEPVLMINGSPSPISPVGCNDWIANPSDLCQVCTLFQCGTASCGGQNVQLLCRVIENEFNLSFCGCVGESQYSFPGVSLLPTDVVKVVLRPAPGALPELPGFGDDDNGALPPACVTCPADLNGDGVINGGDISFILNLFNQVCLSQ